MDIISDIKFEIIGKLLENETYVREIENVLKIPKSTASDKLKELLEQNLVDFKIEGRNKVYFLKNNFETKIYKEIYENYKLLKLINYYPKLNEILNQIKEISQNNLILIFGSYSKFIAGEKSDIDIYIETNDKKIINEIKLINSKISVKYGKFDKNSTLGKEIIKNHIILQNQLRFQNILENEKN